MFRSEQNPPCINRTSAAREPLTHKKFYGTAEAVPLLFKDQAAENSN